MLEIKKKEDRMKNESKKTRKIRKPVDIHGAVEGTQCFSLPLFCWD